MKYAVVSDIHANLHAWNAVKADIDEQGIEVIICLGDIIGYGPRPAETLESVCAVSNCIILGNHEAVIDGSFDRSQFNDEAWKMIDWTGRQLAPDTGKYLEQLPLIVEMNDEGICKTLFVHGTSCQPESFNYILENEDAAKAWGACDATLIFAGHTHEAALFVQEGEHVIKHWVADFSVETGKRYIVNVGSVGMPREADFRASYCIFNTDSGGVLFRRVSYDFDAFRKDVLDIIGESEQSRHVLSYFKQSETRPIQEQLDFIPATESQLMARPVTHGARISIKSNGMSFPKQLRMKKTSVNNVPIVEKKPKEESSGINKKLWFIVCGFLLMIALVAMLIAIFAPAREKSAQAESKVKSDVVLKVAESSKDSTANIANKKDKPVKDDKTSPPTQNAPSAFLEANFGDGTKYKAVSGQDASSLPEGWNETSSWGNPVCSYSFQSEDQPGYLKCVGSENGRIQLYHSFADLSSSKSFKITVRARAKAKTELSVAFVAIGKDGKTYDVAPLQIDSEWKDCSTMLSCGPTPAGIPTGFMMSAGSPGSIDIASVKIEEFSFPKK